jgi:hypothetical protein
MATIEKMKTALQTIYQDLRENSTSRLYVVPVEKSDYKCCDREFLPYVTITACYHYASAAYDQ